MEDAFSKCLLLSTPVFPRRSSVSLSLCGHVRVQHRVSYRGDPCPRKGHGETEARRKSFLNARALSGTRISRRMLCVSVSLWPRP